MSKHDKRRARFGESYRPRRGYHPGGYIPGTWYVDVMPLQPGEAVLTADAIAASRYVDMLRVALRDMRLTRPLRHRTPESETR